MRRSFLDKTTVSHNLKYRRKHITAVIKKLHPITTNKLNVVVRLMPFIITLVMTV